MSGSWLQKQLPSARPPAGVCGRMSTSHDRECLASELHPKAPTMMPCMRLRCTAVTELC